MNPKNKKTGVGGCCSSGGCGKRETFDWVTMMGVSDIDGFDIVEVSFKDGVKKDFFHNPAYLKVTTGDVVTVDVGSGYDVGKITLSGELVKLQIKKKKIRNQTEFGKVLRLATPTDLEKVAHARSLENDTMIRARAIAKSLGLDMKVGDVRYQGDMRKATFYYIANGRVDFRELIKVYAREFRVRVEMRQIGARQESALIGGLGSCGRELCCSSWLNDLKSVSTAAARYQNLSFNQAKLSGQCGRLKCCLNYELDFYVDALRAFPKNVKRLKTEAGVATLVKTDIFRKLMYFAYDDAKQRGKMYALTPEKVKEVQAMNRKNESPRNLVDLQVILSTPSEEEKWDYDSVDKVLELPAKKKRRNKKRYGGRKKNQQARASNSKQRRRPTSRRKPKSNSSNKNKPKRNDSKK